MSAFSSLGEEGVKDHYGLEFLRVLNWDNPSVKACRMKKASLQTLEEILNPLNPKP